MKTVLISAMVLILGMVLWPPKDSLRLGKDLAGGTSLTYTIDLEGVENADETIDRMISVLKERVNPRGLYEISFVRQGNNLMVISMPLPTDEVRQQKADFNAAVAALAAYSVDDAALRRALRRDVGEREDAVLALADTGPRRELLQPLLDAVRVEAEAVRAYRELVRTPGADEDAVEAALAAASAAGRDVDAARASALVGSVTEQQIREVMQRAAEPTVIRSDLGEEPVVLPSPRGIALEALQERLEGLGEAQTRLETVIAEYEEFEAVRQGLDDPADLQRILQGSGVLEFRIAPRPASDDLSPLTQALEDELREQLVEFGPEGVENDDYRWFPLSKLENYIDSAEDLERMQSDPAGYFAGTLGKVADRRDGLIYMLVSNRPGERLTRAEGGGEWNVSNAYPTVDELGRSAIGFEMDARGADLLGELTQNNVQRAMAVVLDGQVVTAPNIDSRISDRGIIQGQFTSREINDLVNTLAAGSLSAKLSDEPISVVTIAPELGAENLQRGLIAGVVALAAVAVFMVFYYFAHGVVAVIALVINAIIILGIMSLSRAAFTLPGIAGIVLTFGMAVDANVLIFERIREELLAGNDLRAAVRIGYQKVLSTIVDANVTNLIVCFVLAYTATEEVKGFAITLGVGVVSTMFTALVVSRVMYTWLLERFGVRHMAQLPMKVSAVQRGLEPKVDWIGLRYVFRVASVGLVGLGIWAIVFQGEKMLDTEFRGGSAITIKLSEGESITKVGADERIAETVADIAEGDPLEDLRNAEAVLRNPDPETNESSELEIKTVVGADSEELRDRALVKITAAFADLIDSRPALAFQGSGEPDARSAPVRSVLDPELGQNFPGTGATVFEDDISAYYQAGAVLLLRDLVVPGSAEGLRPSRESLLERLDTMRNDPQFASTALRRDWELRVLEGSDDAVVTAAVLVRDRSVNVFDENEFMEQLGQEEWDIVVAALTQPQTLAGVQSFSAEIAQSFRGQAIIAVLLSFVLIMIYIWARFGSVRYSLAAITALVHDVVVAIGLIALAEILYDNVPFLVSIGLEPYKIDLALVAAILTIVGYSLNDTIVILDRIRENRGKLAYASKQVINNSINQTVSRTVITSGTTLVALAVLFYEGGPALSSFTYALLCGVLVGTYSSIAVAAPLVYTSKIPEASKKYQRYSSDRGRTPGGGSAGGDTPGGSGGTGGPLPLPGQDDRG